MKELPHTHSCFVCGESNPVGFKLRFWTDGRVVQTRFEPCSHHVGFRHAVHGGLIATLLDEIMVWACAIQTHCFAFSAELKVRYAHPVRPNQSTMLTAELVENRRNKLFEARAELRDSAGQLLAMATGKYIPVRDMDTREMLADLVGELPWTGVNEPEPNPNQA